MMNKALPKNFGGVLLSHTVPDTVPSVIRSFPTSDRVWSRWGLSPAAQISCTNMNKLAQNKKALNVAMTNRAF